MPHLMVKWQCSNQGSLDHLVEKAGHQYPTTLDCILLAHSQGQTSSCSDRQYIHGISYQQLRGGDPVARVPERSPETMDMGLYSFDFPESNAPPKHSKLRGSLTFMLDANGMEITPLK